MKGLRPVVQRVLLLAQPKPN
jgi:hypothetical protein